MNHEQIRQVLAALQSCTYSSSGAHEQEFDDDQIEAASAILQAALAEGRVNDTPSEPSEPFD